MFSSESSGGGLFFVTLDNPQIIQPLAVGLGFAGQISLSIELDPVTPGDQCKVAVAVGAVAQNNPHYSTNLVILDVAFDTAGSPQLGDNLFFVPVGGAHSDAWSPDGEYLVYSTADMPAPALHLVQLIYQGSEIVAWANTKVATDATGSIVVGSRITWSPDGQYVAFTTGAWEIYRGTLALDWGGGQPTISGRCPGHHGHGVRGSAAVRLPNFQKLEGHATNEGLWLESTEPGGGKLRVVVKALGRVPTTGARVCDPQWILGSRGRSPHFAPAGLS